MAGTPSPVPRVEPYRHTAARCVGFDPHAADVAALVAQIVCERCPGVVVDHVGSTAVPGCAGKGIVDLVATYPEGRLAETRAALDALGFQRQTFGDPFPEERPMRVGTVRLGGRRYRVHVHVIAAASPEVIALRRFRDLLLDDPELAGAYVERKRALIAAGVVGSPAYSEAKGGFIRAALEADSAAAPPPGASA
ncbi:MAG TPA: GrpB family protein [Candidatus Dormibacteraeota bacterium]